MRKYTGLDMIRMSRFCKDVNLKGLELLKEYNKQYPEKSEEEQMINLKRALDLCDCEKPGTDNHDLWYCTNCGKTLIPKKPKLTKNNNTLGIGGVRHSANFHAKAIIKKLTSRPYLEDEDGFYDMIADEKQMVEIVERYLNRHYA